MNIIQQEPDKSLDLAEQCFNPDVLLSSNERKAIDYIDTFKVSSDAGVLKYKLNLELIFFTELKSLRVDYISQMNLLNDKLAASKQECIRMVNIIPEQQQQQQSTAKTNEFSSDSAINFDSGSFQTNKVSKPSSTSLTLIDSVCSESEDGKWNYFFKFNELVHLKNIFSLIPRWSTIIKCFVFQFHEYYFSSQFKPYDQNTTKS